MLHPFSANWARNGRIDGGRGHTTVHADLAKGPEDGDAFVQLRALTGVHSAAAVAPYDRPSFDFSEHNAIHAPRI